MTKNQLRIEILRALDVYDNPVERTLTPEEIADIILEAVEEYSKSELRVFIENH